jgi:hypothetical protein
MPVNVGHYSKRSIEEIGAKSKGNSVEVSCANKLR